MLRPLPQVSVNTRRVSQLEAIIRMRKTGSRATTRPIHSVMIIMTSISRFAIALFIEYLQCIYGLSCIKLYPERQTFTKFLRDKLAREIMKQRAKEENHGYKLISFENYQTLKYSHRLFVIHDLWQMQMSTYGRTYCC